uniref:39S ribosomal protein L59, mitochondrial n=1 Tax=Haemonchus contortus TaxID=6289 RepID=A0A7I4YIV1_HAECO
MIKRIFNAVGKRTKDAKFQQKAIKKQDKIEQGEKVLAPRYPTEDKRFQKAMSDEKLREIVNKKESTLVENMNKITIKSTDPVERWTSTKDLPTRESEWLHRNDPVWEYGFYEPEEKRIPKNKLMFREALEVLRARQEIEDDSDGPNAAKMREEARKVYEEHKAVARVDPEKLDEMWEYFRPFVRKDTQKVVSKHDLARLQEYLHGMSDEQTMLQGTQEGFRKLIERNKEALKYYDGLDKNEQKQLEEAVTEQRRMEKERLAERLKGIEYMEEQSKKMVEEAKKKAGEAKKENE